MKAAVVGPVCKDRNIVKGSSFSQPGGTAYYTGQALASLGVETVAFGTFGRESPGWLKGFKPDLVHIMADDTITFINEYPGKCPDERIQRAEIYSNEIKTGDIREFQLAGLDYIILGPLFHDNISRPLVEKLAESAQLVLAAQGMIRHLAGKRIVWKDPESVIGLLPFIDYIFLDADELRFISRQYDLTEGARYLQKNGAANVVATQGEQGSRLFLEDREYKIRAFPPLELADPTGAGDSYLAGFVKALEILDEPLEQGEFAAMTATLSIESRGPFDRTIDEVYRRLGWS